MHSLHRLLVDYDMAMLRALAETRGVPLDTNRQIEAADRLAAALAEPASVADAVAHLSPAGRAALERLAAAGGQMREPQFSREFGQIRPMGPGRLAREAPWQSPENAAEELLYLGLMYRAFGSGPDPGSAGQLVILPDELRTLLPAPQAPPALAVEAVPGPAAGRPIPTLDEDVFLYLVYVHTHDVRAGATPDSRDPSLLRRLGRPAGRRLALARHLAGRLGLIARQGDVLRLQPAPVKEWLSAPQGRQLAALREAWRDDPAWSDLCHVPGLACDSATDWPVRYDAAAARRAVLGLLARCPRDAWWSCASFVAAVKEAAPDFQRPDGDYAAWYIRDATAATPAYLSGFESWDRVEGALLADLLAGPLYWLGIVERAGDEANPLCRLAAAGARFLDGVEGEYAAAAAVALTVRPDLRIEVPAPASRYTRFQLERFADQEQAETCRYRLTPRGLSRALGRGLQIDQIVAFLQQAGGRPVPPNVAAQLTLWAGRLGQVRLEEVTLLEVKNERVLQELRSLPQTRALIDQVLSPTVALVRKKNAARLQAILRDMGYWVPGDVEGGG
jgi:hypothetical protein